MRVLIVNTSENIGGAAIAANSVSGDITLDGAGTGRSLARPGGAPALTLHSTSGDIAIATQ